MAKATLGYSSRTEAVLALRAQGLSTGRIADRVGIKAGTVTALEASALRSSSRKDRPASEQGRAMLVPLDVLSSMRRAASKRGLTPVELAGLIVSTVVDNKLIDAVLDDEVADR